MKKNINAFTLVELIVVIAIIGVLATISVMGFERYQINARDAQRTSSATVIAAELEKFYDLHGEYPSCSVITGTNSPLAKVDERALIAPQADNGVTNSVSCADLTGADNEGDYYAFVGDNSSACVNGQVCLQWTLKYHDEKTGTIASISSRRQANLAMSGAPVLTASAAGYSQVNLSWSALGDAASYSVQYATNSAFSAGLGTKPSSTTSLSITGLDSGKTYYFRVQAVNGQSSGNWSATKSATTAIGSPSGSPTVLAAIISSSTARGTAGSAGSCLAGTTMTYQIRYHSTNVAADGSWSGWVNGTTRDISALQGNKYTFQVQARCEGNNASSGYKLSGTANTVRPINTPTAPGWAITTEWAAGYNYTMWYTWSCPAGTSIGSGGVSSNSGGASRATPWVDWWYVGWNSGQYDIWRTYYGQYTCQTAYSSANSPVTSTQIHAYCSPERRSFSSYPRCDNYGQGQAGNGTGN